MIQGSFWKYIPDAIYVYNGPRNPTFAVKKVSKLRFYLGSVVKRLFASKTPQISPEIVAGRSHKWPLIDERHPIFKGRWDAKQ